MELNHRFCNYSWAEVENRMHGKVSGPEREVTGEWRRLRNEELHNEYS
jgi:hypothetical protein